MTVRLAAAAIALCAGALFHPAAVRASDLPVLTAEQSQRIDALVLRRLQEKQSPGAVIAIVRHGNVERRAYGRLDVDGDMAMDLSAPFEIGSISKQVTATLVMQLVEEGRVDLSDPLSRFFPAYAAARPVTIRHLLQQTSGIPDFAQRPGFMPAAIERRATFAEVLALVDKLPLEFEPGQRWRYSNTNYLLLARVVELVSGQTFEDYQARRILIPVGMTHTYAELPTGRPDGFAQPRGHSTEAGKPVRASSFAPGWVQGAGSLVSTVDDLVRWNRALYAGAIVSAASVAAMSTPTVLSDGATKGYGFGLFVDRQGGHARRWHGGGTLGFSTSTMHYPDDGIDIIVLVNQEDLNASALSAEVFEVLAPDAAVSRIAAPGEDLEVTRKALEWLAQLRGGRLDWHSVNPQFRERLTSNGSAGLRHLAATVDDYGRPEDFVYAGRCEAVQGECRRYRVRFGAQWFRLAVGLDAEGKLAAASVNPD